MRSPTELEQAELSLEAKRVVADVLARASPGMPIVCDADGTLWAGDVGEDLLRLLCEQRALPRHADSSQVYVEYERRLAADPSDAFSFAVEVMEGLELASLRAKCQQSQTDLSTRVFPFVVPLLERLRASGCSVWIVSASPVWSVCAAVERLGIAPERVIGTECRIRDGRLTADVSRPISCGAGKVAALERRGVHPALAVGDGELDLPMLCFADRALVIAPHGEDNELVRSAKERGWPVQRVTNTR